LKKLTQTIHVVEDDKNISEVICEYMKDAGFIVRPSYHGGEALRLFHSAPDIDLFILDIMLPGVSGLELLKEIREIEKYSDTPIVMLTALGDEATQLLSFDALADDYVTKPFSPKVLVKRVQALLRRGCGCDSMLKYEDIVIHYDSYEVYESGRMVTLTLREFELLSALMKNAGKVLNRQQLLNHAWGYDYFGDERVVDVHIKNLRKKLQNSMISTITGVGYKFGGR